LKLRLKEASDESEMRKETCRWRSLNHRQAVCKQISVAVSAQLEFRVWLADSAPAINWPRVPRRRRVVPGAPVMSLTRWCVGGRARTFSLWIFASWRRATDKQCLSNHYLSCATGRRGTFY